MSTNYYADTVLCTHCGHSETVHLGKSAYGWAFSFQGSATVRTFVDWCVVVRNADRITDQYGHTLSADEMIELAANWKGEMWPIFNERDEWVDSAGYRFYGNEFS